MPSAVSHDLSSPGAFQAACEFAAEPGALTAKGSSSVRKMPDKEGAPAAQAAAAGSCMMSGAHKSSGRGSCTSSEKKNDEELTRGSAGTEAEGRLLPKKGNGDGMLNVAATQKDPGGKGGDSSTTDTLSAADKTKEPGEEGNNMALAMRKADVSSISSREQRIFYGAFLLLGTTIAVSQFIALPVLLQMFLYTGTVLYIGSHTSLRQSEVDACTGERTNRTESINHTDALLFPVFGSIALVTMYVAYKFLDASWVNFLLTLYLTAIGFFALAETIHVAISPFLPAWMADESKVVFHVRLPQFRMLLKTPFARAAAAATERSEVDNRPPAAAAEAAAFYCSRSYGQLLCYVAAAVLSSVWLWKKHWVVHNLLAIAFCIQAIGLVSVGNFTVAAILLSGLFVYDIFWVFGTDVMVTVAQSFEGPAKFIFPVRLDPWQQSILGLGDVVVPGVLISMCLRFDYWLHGCRLSNASSSSSISSSKTSSSSSSSGAVHGSNSSSSSGSNGSTSSSGSNSTTSGIGGSSSHAVKGGASAAVAEEAAATTAGGTGESQTAAGKGTAAAATSNAPTAAATTAREEAGGGGVLTRRAKATRAAAAAAAEAEGEALPTTSTPHSPRGLNDTDAVSDNKDNSGNSSRSSDSNSNAACSHDHPPTPKPGDIVHHRFTKFYFWVVMIFYECGLMTTGMVMLLFQHAQPALLYLVPFCLFALFGAAALNGQVKEVLAYNEDDESANGTATVSDEAAAAAVEDAAAASSPSSPAARAAAEGGGEEGAGRR